MTRPIYNGRETMPCPDAKGHTGLWFDKFCDRWIVDGTDWRMTSDTQNQQPKQKWIETVTSHEIGDRDQIKEYAIRLYRLILAKKGRAEIFTTNKESRFVTGLGRSHPVENGFAWHASLGIPFLPGSSVKGMIRSWAIADASPQTDEATINRVLGEAGKRGEVYFLDAVPLSSVKLEMDIMTPHYGGWSKSEPPGDWRSPKPIPFLTTCGNTKFLFSFIPSEAVTEADLNNVSVWLKDALAWAGAGAKTAVGYGRFHVESSGLEKLQQHLSQQNKTRSSERKRCEMMRSPEGRWRLELQELSEENLLEKIRIYLEKHRIQDPIERQAFACAVESVGNVSSWEVGTPQEPQTHVGKKKLQERARLVREAIKNDSI